jgi:dienelactone hydrolase
MASDAAWLALHRHGSPLLPPALTSQEFETMLCRAGRWLVRGRLWLAAAACIVGAVAARAEALVSAGQAGPGGPSDAVLAEYFRQETAAIAAACLDGIRTRDDWERQRVDYRRQLLDMLGLDPLPQKTPLEPLVTGTVTRDEFVVENVHFQSLPGLHVTGNLFLPRGEARPAPAILYVCGHAPGRHEGLNVGGKTVYRHHGEWFARHGYVCLVVDTLQFGEIEGIHHGLYRYGRWWWQSRGYTPAGVETWNAIRAIDYLQSRPEVDGSRIGMTGRSGGGATTWWTAAVDERIRVAVPVAGITDLENHVVDGCIERHCDCMFFCNTRRWDFPAVAALVAPRPLLIGNTDRDGIFPLDGVVRVYERARRIYDLYGAGDEIGLSIGPGPHRDTQDLQVAAFRWFDQHLRGEPRVIEKAAVSLSGPGQLRVFADPPADEANTRIDERFVPPAAAAPPPADASAWARQREAWLTGLRDTVFRGWPADAGPLDVVRAWSADRDGVTLTAYDFTSQGPFRLRLHVAHRTGLTAPRRIVLDVLDREGWNRFLGLARIGFAAELGGAKAAVADEGASAEAFARLRRQLLENDWAVASFAPRGVGPTAWDERPSAQTHIRRRFYVLGQTLEGMQAYDVQRAIAAVRSLPAWGDPPLWLEGRGEMAGVAVYAAIFAPSVTGLELWNLPASHRDGPAFLGVQRVLDMPQAVTLAAERGPVVLHDPAGTDAAWEYPRAAAAVLGWGADRIRVARE